MTVYCTRLQAIRERANPADQSGQDAVRAILLDLDRTGMSVQLLKDTRIGVELNKVFWRYHTAEDIAENCVDLVQRWKTVAASAAEARGRPRVIRRQSVPRPRVDTAFVYNVRPRHVTIID